MVDAMDRDGIKTVLPKGAIGYDDYVPGGDAGRVYIGTGTANIPLAKKDEVQTMVLVGSDLYITTS